MPATASLEAFSLLPGQRSAEAFRKVFLEHGFVVVPQALPESWCLKAHEAIVAATANEAQRRGEAYREEGQLLCAAAHGGIFLEVLENNALFEPVEWLIDPWFITYIYSTACIPPLGGSVMASSIHVDWPRDTGPYLTGVGLILATSAFTAENGATWVLPGSHCRQTAPTEAEFYAQAIRLEIPAGSLCYFHQRLWHAAGVNHSPQWRSALLFGFVRPWVKQRLDVPRYLESEGIDWRRLPPNVQQRLGCLAQPPASWQQYFAPPEARSFRQPVV